MSRRVDCGEGVQLERGVACALSDGTILISDHYYAPRAEPLPTLLMRQPYGRDIASTVVYAHPAWFARQGYNVVVQDVRGRGDSQGTFYPFRHEARDGAETIAFLRKRPECNGRIGMYGFSYQGMTQLLAAAAQPEGLQCIAPAMTAHDLYHGWFYHHGALRLASSLGWGLQMMKEDARRLKLDALSDELERAWANLPAQYLITPAIAHPGLNAADAPSYVRDWLMHDQAAAYWQAMDISRRLTDIRIPALHISGWYDTYLKGSVDSFNALRAHAGSAHARRHQYLLAGPWVHIPWADRIGPHPLGSHANADTDTLLLRWFNHWLKDTHEFDDEPPIRHFAMNGNAWFDADDWPEATCDFYLHSHGRANSSKGDGLLTLEAPTNDRAPDVFVFDPEVPVVAPGGIAATAGPADQAIMELANNVLIYTSAPLERPLHVFGSPEVAICLATSSPQADLAVKLVCLRSNGVAQFVCIGIARSSFLFADSYSVDTVHLWRFELEPTSCIFAADDRVRIEIASSAYPLYDRNPGTHVAAWQAGPWNWRRSTQSLYHDQLRPSVVRLPILAVTAP